jgi:multiple sugar transport system permease protein
MVKIRSGFDFGNIVYLLPLGLFYAIFLVYPLINVVYLSFFGGIGKLAFVGFKNYKIIATDRLMIEILGNSFRWVVLGSIIKIIFGLLLALYLNREFKGKKILMIIILLPWATPYIISAITWRWMYDPAYGHLNDILLRFNLIGQPLAFLGDTSSSLIATVICHAWTGIPFCALTFLSILYSIPDSLYEAASVDGAGSIRRFFSITLPIIMPGLLTLSILVSVWGFNAFGVIWSMTQGGPLNSSEILISYLYRSYFIFNRFGYGSAVAVISFAILLCLSSFYIWGSRRASYE